MDLAEGGSETVVDKRISLRRWVRVALAVASGVAFLVVATYGSAGPPQASPYGHRVNTGAEALMREGRDLEKRGAIDKAIAIYEQVIRDYPDATYENEVGEGRYSEDASDRLNVLHCLKERRSDFSTKSDADMVRIIQEALGHNDMRQLIRSASCDFMVGKAETDDVWLMPPRQVMPAIIDLLPVLNWSLVRTEVSDKRKWVVVPARTHESEHTFYLEKAGDRWRWAGYYTTDGNILGSLRKLGRERK